MKWNWNRKWLWLLYAAAIATGAYAGYVAWFAGDRLDLGAGFASAEESSTKQRSNEDPVNTRATLE